MYFYCLKNKVPVIFNPKYSLGTVLLTALPISRESQVCSPSTISTSFLLLSHQVFNGNKGVKRFSELLYFKMFFLQSHKN